MAEDEKAAEDPPSTGWTKIAYKLDGR